jgi:hypothetical protein
LEETDIQEILDTDVAEVDEKNLEHLAGLNEPQDKEYLQGVVQRRYQCSEEGTEVDG